MNTTKPQPDEVPDHHSGKKRKAQKPASAQIDAHIGKELRELYASILEEPIPDRFLALIQSFDSSVEDADKPNGKGGAP